MESRGYVFTSHARFEMKRRGLSETLVRGVLDSPGQRLEIRPGRVVYQSIVEGRGGSGRQLLRVFVDVDRAPAEIVTAYRTTRVTRYWRDSSA